MSGAPAREPVSSELMAPVLETARRLGVEADPEEARAKGAVWARLDDVRVAMGVRFVSGRAVGFAHFAEAPEPVVGPFTVEPWTGQARGRQPSGDSELDAALAVHGDPPVVRGALDAANRPRLVDLFAAVPRPASLQVSGRRLTLRGPDSRAISADRMEAEVRLLVALTRDLRLSRRTLLERVVTNALEDDSPHVRENNAAVLGELMSKAGPDARYGAAVRLLPSEEIPLDHRLDVLRMVRSMPAARVRPLMQLMLEEGALELARRAVGWVKETRCDDCLRHLVKVMHRFDDRALARSVAEAMGELRDPKAQPTLLNLLNREDDAVRISALEALGRVGGREVLPTILPYTKGLFVDRDLKRAAREAMERIEARGEVGAEGLVDPDLLDDERGGG